MLPDEFDARRRWPGCISDVMDQKACNGCWAYSTCLALSDRIRILGGKSPATAQLFVTVTRNGDAFLNSLSPAYMIRNNLCNTELAHRSKIDPNFCQMGCGGGFIDLGTRYLMVRGSITLMDDAKRNPSAFHYTASKAYRIDGGVEAISREIMNRGPVIAGIAMYQNCHDEEFDDYYDSASGEVIFNHAICIVGWKRHNGKSYWICRNSYGKDYMDGGYMYLLRGSNFCNVESDVWGILPRLTR